MKKRRSAVKVTSYAAGIFAIASALSAAVLLIMTASGFLFPRKEKITLHTETISKIYDASPLDGGVPILTYGELHPGHQLVMTVACQYTDVGEYENKPTYMILDASGADVTDMYDVTTDFGKLKIEGRPLTVQCTGKKKVYDQTPLESDEIRIVSGSLADGHSFICTAKTSITAPGEQKILPAYSILAANGVDVTDQYDITEYLGSLVVKPIPIAIRTGSAEKIYDGTPLSCDEWSYLNGEFLDGHKLSVKCITEESEVGIFDNHAATVVSDADGNNVSHLYDITIYFGTLTISARPIYISTGYATKEYDGSPLQCDEWSITSGSIGEDEHISMIAVTEITEAGSAENELHFSITDSEGNDITHRYKIILDAGQLTVTPRPLTIRTGSATMVYDGSALVCEEYEITKGSLCEGDMLNLSFTSIVNIGYSQNYIIDLSVYGKNENGDIVDVSKNYRVSYDYGTLTITAS